MDWEDAILARQEMYEIAEDCDYDNCENCIYYCECACGEESND